MKAVRKRQTIALLLAIAIALGGFLWTLDSKTAEKRPYASIQVGAAERMAKAEKILLDVVLEEGIEIEANDYAMTGLLGPEWTSLTTSLGSEEAKRTSLDPNFAALLVHYFQSAGLKAGDTIAVGSSGSFPGLMLATLCAAAEMELSVRMIASFGASMYGATRPELNIVRIAEIVKNAGLVDYRLLAVSPGGDNDYAEGLLFDDTRDIIIDLAAQSGVVFIDENNINKSIARRLELYGDDIACFVNVGGASANFGTSSYALNMGNGLILNPPRIPTIQDRGLLYEYAARGIPVIHLLNVKKLANDNGIPFDKVPFEQPGVGGVYYQTKYSGIRAAITGLCSITALIFLWPKKQRVKKNAST
jgi:poly-gamma-glutamate system protein